MGPPGNTLTGSQATPVTPGYLVTLPVEVLYDSEDRSYCVSVHVRGKVSPPYVISLTR